MFGIIVSLAVAGVLLVVAEMFLPGLVAGTLGVIALIAALVLTYSTYGSQAGNIFLALLIVLKLILFLWWIYYFPRSSMVKKLTLSASSGPPGNDSGLAELIDREGVALTQLRPSGTAFIDGRRIDVLSADGFVEPQERVKVVQVEGAKVTVRKAIDLTQPPG